MDSSVQACGRSVAITSQGLKMLPCPPVPLNSISHMQIDWRCSRTVEEAERVPAEKKEAKQMKAEKRKGVAEEKKRNCGEDESA